jgi:hypothetical protein
MKMKIQRLLFIMILIIIVSFFIAVNYSTGAEWKGEVRTYKTIPAFTDSEKVVQSGTGLQVSLHHKNLYAYLSKDTTPIRFAGQSGIDIDLWSVGIGIQQRLNKHFLFSFDAGWYEPKGSGLGVQWTYPDSPFSEGLCRYLNKYLAPDTTHPVWDYYTYDLHGAIGGKLNIEFEHEVTDNLVFNIFTGFRYLKMLENVQGHDYGFDHIGYWTVRYDRDFSCWQIGMALTYSF